MRVDEAIPCREGKEECEENEDLSQYGEENQVEDQYKAREQEVEQPKE